MKIVKVLVMVCMLLTCAAQADAGLFDSVFGKVEQPKSTQLIKVLIAQKVDSAKLEVKGAYTLYDPNPEVNNEQIGGSFFAKARLIQALSTGIKWGEEFPGIHQIKIVPDNPSTTMLVNGIEYQGSLYIYADRKGKLMIVNELDLEDYLRSLLASELNLQADEAIAAATIAARTQAYYQLTSAKNALWQVEAKQSGYPGYAVTSRNDGIEEAIEATRNMILSRTGTYEKVITPFAVKIQETGKSSFDGHIAILSLEEVDALANNGNNAAQILTKAFPNVNIVLVK